MTDIATYFGPGVSTSKSVHVQKRPNSKVLWTDIAGLLAI